MQFMRRFNTRQKLDFGSIENPKPVAARIHQWIAHICLTTTVSISSSKTTSNSKKRVKIPDGFFFNSGSLSRVLPGAQTLVTLTMFSCPAFPVY
jgi:hypothetical protein